MTDAYEEPKTMKLLQVKDLTVQFGNRQVVRSLSFDVHEGETLGIVGASGSGKSVTALAIMRLLEHEKYCRVTEGAVFWNDGNASHDIYKMNEHEIRSLRGAEIAIIFQEPLTALNPVMSVGAQIAEVLRRVGIKNRKERKMKVVELIDRVRIASAEERANSYPHELSGGMRQRIMIAMALAGNPKLLIADEPTTALDVTVQGEILALLQSFKEESKLTMIFITHDMGVIAQVADRTMVMKDGERIEVQRTVEIFESPVTEYTKTLIQAVPQMRY